ncbi:hypothetical protein FLX08_34510 [Microbispora hainanensis]|uniref:Uncharacterized protein n=1 Tax=Microbispora hainanensis TaxID=568844 RepID=A0A544YAT9_9ACTN|nr:hypothetical protein FLX08_34510 [Microbispora hainanensis]
MVSPAAVAVTVTWGAPEAVLVVPSPPVAPFAVAPAAPSAAGFAPVPVPAGSADVCATLASNAPFCDWGAGAKRLIPVTVPAAPATTTMTILKAVARSSEPTRARTATILICAPAGGLGARSASPAVPAASWTAAGAGTAPEVGAGTGTASAACASASLALICESSAL